MKAVQLQGGFSINELHVFDAPEPTPGPGQVLLDMKAWSLNYRDLMIVKGMYNPKLQLPFVPLSDGVGQVIAIGAGVSRVRVGDRVASCFMQGWVEGDITEAKARTSLGGGQAGMLAERVVLSEDGVIHVPAHLTDEQAATLPCAALTAWNALVPSGNLKAGETVLIQGTGGVSLFALQFAKMHGARVFATSGNDGKLQRALDLGAEVGVNYKTEPEWENSVRRWTKDVGVDHIVEVGGAGTLGKSLKAVRHGGNVYLIGVLSGGNAINPLPILMKSVRVQGIFVGSRAMFEAMNRAIEAAKMQPVVDRVFGFDEIQPALRHMENASHFGKICLKR